MSFFRHVVRRLLARYTPEMLYGIIKDLVMRYERTGAVQDLERAIRGCEALVVQTQAHSPRLPSYLRYFGVVLRMRYDQTEDLTDLDRAIQAWKDMLALLPPDSPDLPFALDKLGSELLVRYDRLKVPEDLERAISIFESLLNQLPSSSSNLPLFLGRLGITLRKRFECTGVLADLERVVQAWEQVLARLPSDSPMRIGVLQSLSSDLFELYQRTGSWQVLERMYQISEDVVARTSMDPSSLPASLVNLSVVLHARYKHIGEPADLDRAIQVAQQAVSQTLPNAHELPMYLHQFGTCLMSRYRRTDTQQDLEGAMQAYEQALEKVPPGSSLLPVVLNSLGNALRSRFHQTGVCADLERAIQVYEQAIAQAPPDSREALLSLSNLGTVLNDRYDRTGDPADLTRAIRVYEQAVEQALPGSPHMPMYLEFLGDGLLARYRRTSSGADLERAIQVYEQAVAQSPPASPTHKGYLNSLGVGLRARYNRIGSIADLERAIEIFEQVVQLTSADNPELPGHLNSLGNGLRASYARTRTLATLERAIQVYDKAVQLMPTGRSGRATYLSNLGTALNDRYDRTGDPADLAQAIRVYKKAVAETASDSPRLPTHLSNLGRGLSTSYRRKRKLTTLKRSIEIYERAIAKTPPGSPELPLELNNLGLGLSERYQRTKNAVDLQRAIDVWKQAAKDGLDVAVEESLRSARNWVNSAFERHAWKETADAYNYARQAAKRLLQTQFVRRSKEMWLRETQALPHRTAYALAKIGKLQEAVVVLESGRAQLLTAVLERDRADLERIREVAPEVYERYQRAASCLRQLEEGAPQESSLTITSARSDIQVRLHEEAQQAWSDLTAAIANIRRISGYEDFLAEPSYEDVVAALHPGLALVYLVATPAGSLGLIVHRSDDAGEVAIEPVWLDAFSEMHLHELLVGPKNDPALGGWFGSYERQQEQFADWLATIEDVTHRLWDVVMGPVVDRLETLQVPQAVLIPTDLLAVLPLHAAWTERTGRRYYALDAMTFSYASSSRALIHARRIAALPMGNRLLAVDEPMPITGGGSLPNSHAEVEAIASHFTEVEVFQHRQATRRSILDALPTAQVAHFSCHGVTNWNEPLRSGLLLAHDEMLTVHDLFQVRLTGARLATLSACETGIVGTQLPDEVIALPSAFLQAGFAGTVASLWSVTDISTAMLMERFYRLWREEGLQPALALREAQRWLRDTTNQQKAEYFARDISALTGAMKMPEEVAADFFSQVLSREPKACSFQHPFWWAAFYLTGV